MEDSGSCALLIGSIFISYSKYCRYFDDEMFSVSKFLLPFFVFEITKNYYTVLLKVVLGEFFFFFFLTSSYFGIHF